MGRWYFPFTNSESRFALLTLAIREIEEEELHWQEKGEPPPSEDDPTKP